MYIYTVYRYDITPINNITAIATEVGLIPPTSIPILIKEYNKPTPTNTASANTTTTNTNNTSTVDTKQ